MTADPASESPRKPALFLGLNRWGSFSRLERGQSSQEVIVKLYTGVCSVVRACTAGGQ